MNMDTVSERDYRRLSDLIRTEWGLDFSPAKRVMVETRLGKRARALGLSSLSAYCEYLHSPEGRKEEPTYLVDAITTKTDFFREPSHFDYLTGAIVPEMARSFGAGIRRPLTVWSSACSTGEEPYTIAMVLAEYAASVNPQAYRFTIEATDISEVVAETGRCAIYSEAAIEPVPDALRLRYLLRSKDRQSNRVRIVPELRARVHFRTLNLLSPDYGFAEPLDVIFCRNVMIYFDRATQHKILSQMCQALRIGGFLIMGHAESLSGMDLPLAQANPTVYRRRNE
jgi:chemotaxis protein methyltransferase CheR